MIDDWPPTNINRNNYIWWHKYSTRWGDNDIYGHVNNNIYLVVLVTMPALSAHILTYYRHGVSKRNRAAAQLRKVHVPVYSCRLHTARLK